MYLIKNGEILTKVGRVDGVEVGSVDLLQGGAGVFGQLLLHMSKKNSVE